MRRGAEASAATLEGWVRLENVGEADAPARVVAQTEVSMPAGALRVPFRLALPPDLDGQAHYSLAAELAGAGVLFGTVQSHPWLPDAGGEPAVVEVVRWR